MTTSKPSTNVVKLGIGFYTVPEAARLLHESPRNINRWLGGYKYSSKNGKKEMPPLWTPELPAFGDHLELSFKDLIELRFIKAFTEVGLGIKAIRNCLEYARECVHDERPFSTRRFQTDGKTIFLESLQRNQEDEVLDLKKRQYAFKTAIERTFKDLDIADDAIARWRPYNGKQSIVIDPTRAFGQPIASEYGIPTIALAEALEAEGSIKRVSLLYEVSEQAVRDAVAFEKQLEAA